METRSHKRRRLEFSETLTDQPEIPVSRPIPALEITAISPSRQIQLFRFLGLSPELRNKIYGFCFQTQEALSVARRGRYSGRCFGGFSAKPGAPYKGIKKCVFHLGLLRANRQISREALALLYKQMFCFQYFSALDGFLDVIGSSFIHLRKIILPLYGARDFNDPERLRCVFDRLVDATSLEIIRDLDCAPVWPRWTIRQTAEFWYIATRNLLVALTEKKGSIPEAVKVIEPWERSTKWKISESRDNGFDLGHGLNGLDLPMPTMIKRYDKALREDLISLMEQDSLIAEIVSSQWKSQTTAFSSQAAASHGRHKSSTPFSGK